MSMIQTDYDKVFVSYIVSCIAVITYNISNEVKLIIKDKTLTFLSTDITITIIYRMIFNGLADREFITSL